MIYINVIIKNIETIMDHVMKKRATTLIAALPMKILSPNLDA
jgi:hypothetical protein